MPAQQPITALAPQGSQNATELTLALKAAGDNLRLQVLSILVGNSFSVLELCQIFSAKQSGMSHHLKVLANAGLVSTRREGNTIFYRRCDDECSTALNQLRTAIYEAADSLTLEEKQQEHIEAVYLQRSEASRAFFADNANAFREQQDLIAEYEVYGREVAKLLDSATASANQKALEVGPGTGEFLPELSSRFENVLAIDTSKEMLQKSRDFCEGQKLTNIEFIHADTSHCHSIKDSLDCAVINMVLHHTPSPSQIFEDVATALKGGGILVICELAAHDQDWVRQACGDQWLGFEASDLSQWAIHNVLEKKLSRHIALRNGFQIQIHQFIKL